MVKAIFFDIDGTLVSFKTHEVPRSTIDALDILRKKGIKVFIATGRHYSSINNLGDLKFDGYVTLNGGYCFAGEDKVIYKHSIPDRDIDALIRYLETEESFPCAFVQEKEIFMNYKDETVEEIFNMLNFLFQFFFITDFTFCVFHHQVHRAHQEAAASHSCVPYEAVFIGSCHLGHQGGHIPGSQYDIIFLVVLNAHPVIQGVENLTGEIQM